MCLTRLSFIRHFRHPLSYLSPFFFFFLVSHITISSLVRVLLTVSSQEIYWKSRGTISENTVYTVIVLRLVKKKKFFFFIIIANGISTPRQVGILLDLSTTQEPAPCAALSEKSVVLQARADAARAAPVVGARSDLTRFTDRFNSI